MKEKILKIVDLFHLDNLQICGFCLCVYTTVFPVLLLVGGGGGLRLLSSLLLSLQLNPFIFLVSHTEVFLQTSLQPDNIPNVSFDVYILSYFSKKIYIYICIM